MNRNAAYVALAFVALATGLALNVIWRVGSRVERELMEFGGAALPAATQFAFDFRGGLTVFEVGVFVAAVLVHGQRFAVLALVLIGLLQLALAGGYGLALWLPYRLAF